MTKKEERKAIFDKTNGRCGYCGEGLNKGWHVDHMKPIMRISKWDRKKHRFISTGEMENPENDTFENKIASCPSCNTRKGSETIDGFRYGLMRITEMLDRDSSIYRFGIKYGMIKETGVKIIFYFETLNLKL